MRKWRQKAAEPYGSCLPTAAALRDLAHPLGQAQKGAGSHTGANEWRGNSSSGGASPCHSGSVAVRNGTTVTFGLGGAGEALEGGTFSLSAECLAPSVRQKLTVILTYCTILAR